MTQREKRGLQEVLTVKKAMTVKAAVTVKRGAHC
jgi:hypothetical protein